MNKKLYTVNLDKVIHDDGVKKANKERRSFSSYVEHLIAMDLEEKAIQNHN